MPQPSGRSSTKALGYGIRSTHPRTLMATIDAVADSATVIERENPRGLAAAGGSPCIHEGPCPRIYQP